MISNLRALVIAPVLALSMFSAPAIASAEDGTYTDARGDSVYYDWVESESTTFNDPETDITTLTVDRQSAVMTLTTQVAQYAPNGLDYWVYRVSTRDSFPPASDGNGVYEFWIDDETGNVTVFDDFSRIISCSEAFVQRVADGMRLTAPSACVGDPTQVWFQAVTYWTTDYDCVCNDSVTDYAPDLSAPFFGPFSTSSPSPASPSPSPSSPAASPSPSASATAPAPSPTSAPPAGAPTLSLSPATISAGEATTVTYRGAPHSVADILSRTQPSTVFTKIGSVHLDGNGIGTSTHKPQKNTRITARSANGTMSTTAPIIAVRSVASFNARRVGTRTYTFTGRVYPALHHRVVSLYRNGVLVAQGHSDATGIYTITKTLAAGTFTFQVRTPNDQYNLGATSRQLRLLIS